MDERKVSKITIITLGIVAVLAIAIAFWGWLRPVVNTDEISTSAAMAAAEEPTRDPLVMQMATQLANLQLQPTSLEVDEPTEEPVETSVPSGKPVEPVSGSSNVEEVLRISSALDYPDIIEPDALRQTVFPDVPNNDRPALVEYSLSWEDGDYFEDSKGDVDLPEWHYRVITAGIVNIPGIVNCEGGEKEGCLVILINHFGPTAMWKNSTVDNGFTVAGRIWNMSEPSLVTLAGQALLDHYVYRMTMIENPGANCSTIKGCEFVEWHIVIVGNGEAQVHWTGLFQR